MEVNIGMNVDVEVGHELVAVVELEINNMVWLLTRYD